VPLTLQGYFPLSPYLFSSSDGTKGGIIQVSESTLSRAILCFQFGARGVTRRGVAFAIQTEMGIGREPFHVGRRDRDHECMSGQRNVRSVWLARLYRAPLPRVNQS
jgi:hypothetical protein